MQKKRFCGISYAFFFCSENAPYFYPLVSKYHHALCERLDFRTTNSVKFQKKPLVGVLRGQVLYVTTAVGAELFGNKRREKIARRQTHLSVYPVAGVFYVFFIFRRTVIYIYICI